MHLIIQVTAHDNPAALVKNLRPLALQRRGEEIDTAFRNRTMENERNGANGLGTWSAGGRGYPQA